MYTVRNEMGDGVLVTIPIASRAIPYGAKACAIAENACFLSG